ncbi:putative GTP-binding protein, partial [Suillus placidus]
GYDRFRAIAIAYYRGIDGIVMLYDVTNQTTFDSVIIWVSMMLLGNKADGSDARIVTEEQGKALADQLDIKFMETHQQKRT